MRDLELYVPSDCVAAQTADDHAVALEQMRRTTRARVFRYSELDIPALLA
jgi:hypothetical protein